MWVTAAQYQPAGTHTCGMHAEQPLPMQFAHAAAEALPPHFWTTGSGHAHSQRQRERTGPWWVSHDSAPPLPRAAGAAAAGQHTSRLKMAVACVWACTSSPEWMASTMARVHFSFMRDPTPYLRPRVQYLAQAFMTLLPAGRRYPDVTSSCKCWQGGAAWRGH